MYNTHDRNSLELGRFGEYLLRRRIVPEKHARYYVEWVRRFLSEVPEKGNFTLSDRISVFVENLKPRFEGWQVEQAERAVRLYFTNFLAEKDRPQAALAPDSKGQRGRSVRRRRAITGVFRLLRR
jgi:hypothetical protein